MNDQGSIPRTTYFPGFDFGAAPATAFNPAGRAIVLDALVGRMVDPALATDPNVAEVRAELDSLITRLRARRLDRASAPRRSSRRPAPACSAAPSRS